MANKNNKKFQKQPNSNRTFSESFKRSKVKDLVSRRIKVRDICELYEVSRTSVYKWIYLYSDSTKEVKTVVQMESEAQKTKILMQRLSEYERIIGQKQMTIDLLEKGYEFASEDLGYDVKKKYVLQPWNGSENTLTNTDIK